MSKFDSIKTANLPFEIAVNFDVSTALSSEEKAEYHKKIADWSKKAKATLQSGIRQQGISGTSLINSIKPKVYKTKNADVGGIAFSFNRHGIYVHKGAGIGMGGQKGSTWLNRYGIRRETNPESLGKLASGNRQAKPWFDALDNDLQELADIVAENYAGKAIDVSRLFNKQ